MEGDTTASPFLADELVAAELTRPIKDVNEKWRLVPAFLQARGLVQQHIESFDYFINEELRNILEANKEVRSEVSDQRGEGAHAATAEAGERAAPVAPVRRTHALPC